MPGFFHQYFLREALILQEHHNFLREQLLYFSRSIIFYRTGIHFPGAPFFPRTDDIIQEGPGYRTDRLFQEKGTSRTDISYFLAGGCSWSFVGSKSDLLKFNWIFLKYTLKQVMVTFLYVDCAMNRIAIGPHRLQYDCEL